MCNSKRKKKDCVTVLRSFEIFSDIFQLNDILSIVLSLIKVMRWVEGTLKYLINEHARLLNLKKNSTLLALIPSCSFISFQEKYLWIVKKNVLKFPKIFQIFAKNLFEFKQQKLIKTTKCWELHYYSECHISFTMLLYFQLVYSILLVYHRWSNVQPCLLIPSCLFIRYVRVGSWRRASSYTNYLNIST